MAQFELTLLDWAEEHKGARDDVAFADKCWPAFSSQSGFEPCYVNSRLVTRSIPVACEVDVYGALSEYLGMCASANMVTLLDINNSAPRRCGRSPSPSAACSATARGVFAATSPRARSCRCARARLAASPCLASRRWTASIATCSSRSTSRTMAPLRSSTAARCCSTSSGTWAWATSRTTSRRACRISRRTRLRSCLPTCPSSGVQLAIYVRKRYILHAREAPMGPRFALQ